MSVEIVEQKKKQRFAKSERIRAQELVVESLIAGETATQCAERIARAMKLTEERAKSAVQRGLGDLNTDLKRKNKTAVTFVRAAPGTRKRKVDPEISASAARLADQLVAMMEGGETEAV